MRGVVLVESQRNQRWPRLHDLQPKLPRQIVTKSRSSHLGNRQAAGGDDQRLGAKLVVVVPGAQQKTIFPRYLRHVHVRLNPHADGAALRFQHGHDLLRRAVAEELAQSFLVVGDRVLLHQRNEIRGRVARQRGLGKVRIGGDEIFRTAVQVGEVAAPAAGDQDLFADALGPLQHGHAAPAPAGFNGAHQAGCSAAENDHVKTLHRKRARKTLLPQRARRTQRKRRTCVTI